MAECSRYRRLRDLEDDFEDGYPRCPTDPKYFHEEEDEDASESHYEGQSCDLVGRWGDEGLSEGRADGFCENCQLNDPVFAEFNWPWSRLFAFATEHLADAEYKMSRGREELSGTQREAIRLVGGEVNRVKKSKSKDQRARADR